ncbi:MAG: DUF2334 domain-containing protein [bacterium]|nr:DUF2334 domain-containing protein [bacterium]
MKIILRDDDTSTFTHPDMLEQVYAPLWMRGLPVCLGVIPLHDASIRIPGASGTFIDLNIPPAFRGQEKHFPLTDNPTLCDFLYRLAKQGLVELCLHGYTHRWLECVVEAGKASDTFRHHLEAGLAMFAEVFPGIPIRTFLAPYEAISAHALAHVLDAGLTISLHPANVPPPFGQVPAHQAIKAGGGYIFGSAAPHPFDDLLLWNRALEADEPDVTFVCLNHYWSFFADWSAPEADALQRWHGFLQRLVTQYPDRLTTFGALSLWT